MKVKTKKIFIILLIVLIVATLGFIHGNSSLSVNESMQSSSRLYAKLQPLLPWLINDSIITPHVFRKLAHFSEFFLLGLEFSLLFILLEKFSLKGVIFVLLIGILDASLDETLQIFFGRGASVIDVFIDFSGYFLATAITFLIYKLAIRLKEKSSR